MNIWKIFGGKKLRLKISIESDKDDKCYTEEEFIEFMNEINNMPKELQLVDPRWWVRKIGKRK